jgi:glycosyltransferase involved in cell wall biosynthesis
MPDLRIALVTTYPPGKGSLNEYAYHFVRYLRQKTGVKELILLVDELPGGESYPAPENEPGLVPMRVIPCWRFEAWRNPLGILTALRRTKPDVVLFNIQFASFGSGKIPVTLGLTTPGLCKLFGFPTIVLLHNIMETIDLKQAGFGANPIMEKIIRLFGTIVTRMLLTADWVALTIPKYVEILEKKYRTSNVLLAPHGAFEEAGGLVLEVTSHKNQLQIMAFGKFGTYKKVEDLIEAFKSLQTANRPPLELVIAGTNSPNAPGYLEKIAQDNAGVPGLRFTGYVAEEAVPQIFGEADVVVFPYTSTTGSSGVLHQAGEYGKAVVLPHIGDLAEVISEEGYTGEFFEPDSVPELAQAIARLLDDPERRREIGTQNYLAAHGLPITEVVDWYLLHFQSLLQRRKIKTTLSKPARLWQLVFAWKKSA